MTDSVAAAAATPGPTALSVAEASDLARAVLDEVERAVVGKRLPLTLVLASVLAKGHVLLEDFPGLGKTLAARSLARVLGLDKTPEQKPKRAPHGSVTPAEKYRDPILRVLLVAPGHRAVRPAPARPGEKCEPPRPPPRVARRTSVPVAGSSLPPHRACGSANAKSEVPPPSSTYCRPSSS